MREHDVLDDPGTSEWLRGALRAALECDPVRAANDAEVLRVVLQQRAADAGAYGLGECFLAVPVPAEASSSRSNASISSCDRK